MNKWSAGKFEIPDHCSDPVPIVSDAAIASEGVVDGKFIPLLIVDTTHRRDIDDMVKFHDHTTSGDVYCTWGSHSPTHWKKPHKIEKLALFLEFQRPSQTFVILELDIIERGIVIETILNSKAFYLQPGRIGERFIYDTGKPKIMVEVPDTGFHEIWDELWRNNLIKKFKKSGLNRASATQAADDTIKMTRKMWAFRMGQQRTEKFNNDENIDLSSSIKI